MIKDSNGTFDDYSKDAIKQKANNKYKNLSEEQKQAKRKYGQDR